MTETVSELPPGQVRGKRWVIYAALGVPKVDVEKWRLRVDGLVGNPVEFTYQELTNGMQAKYAKSFHCLLPQSVVFANPEPKEIRNLAVGDSVIGRDGRRHRVARLIKKEHQGGVIGIKASYLPPTIMTPEHPVLTIRGHPGVGKSRSKRRQRTFRSPTAPRWTRADKLRVGDYVFFPKYRQISDRESVTYRGEQFRIDHRLASVLGWYCAEGSGGDSVSRNVVFSLGSGETDNIEKLRGLLQVLFQAKTSIYGNERGTLAEIVVTSSAFPDMARAFKSWCGEKASTKKIPDFILNAKVEVLRAFLVGLFEGDGYSPVKTGKFSRYNDFVDLTTSSRILAYQVILAMSKLGIPAEMVDHPGSVRPGYSIRARGKKIRNLFPEFPVVEKIDKFHYWETSKGFYYPIRRIWSEKYTGPVYDFQAPGFTMLSPFVTQDCVTKWSIENVQWEGVSIRTLAAAANPSPDAKWVMFHCEDGYTAPVPAEDALADDAIVAFKINGRPLSAEQGFPARPFMPNLYGWKSAKWLSRIEFIRDYKDGYWEMYGYHERGNVWEEERFKGHSGKHSKRTAIGTTD